MSSLYISSQSSPYRRGKKRGRKRRGRRRKKAQHERHFQESLRRRRMGPNVCRALPEDLRTPCRVLPLSNWQLLLRLYHLSLCAFMRGRAAILASVSSDDACYLRHKETGRSKTVGDSRNAWLAVWSSCNEACTWNKCDLFNPLRRKIPVGNGWLFICLLYTGMTRSHALSSMLAAPHVTSRVMIASVHCIRSVTAIRVLQDGPMSYE